MIVFNHDTINQLITQHGSVALFALLSLGIIGLPIPDETLLIIAGFLLAKGKLSLIATLIAALCGSMMGITISYFIGYTLGFNVLLRYGKYIGITEKKFAKAHEWFEHYGKWLLLIGYFIPGVRHLTGIVAGMARLEYYIFATFAYVGALIWSSTFLFIGYFFYAEWQNLHLHNFFN